jgi:uncharacterized lipoprotein YmbA
MIPIRTLRAAAVALTGSGLLAACSLNPQEDPTRYYVLTSISEDPGLWSAAGLTGNTLQEAVESAGTAVDVTVGVGPITLPTYLRRSRMVTRSADNELQFHETERWGEPLQEAVQYRLAENLGVLLRGQVVMHPWYATDAPDYAVSMDIVRFERDGGTTVTIHYRWQIRDSEDRIVADDAGALQDPAAEPTMAASVNVQSQQIAAISRNIADALERLTS